MKISCSRLSSIFIMSWITFVSSLMAAPSLAPIDLPTRLSGSPIARAISYSGYRNGQNPGGAEPSYAEIAEDLKLLSQNFNLIRLYGTGTMSQTVLKVIEQEKLPLKVMQGAWLSAEVNNPHSPWGQPLSPERLAANALANLAEVDQLIKLAKAYPKIITAVSVGNEVLVDWSDHLVPSASLLSYVKKVKASGIPQLVTIADNYVPWLNGEDLLVAQLDFITIHSYPIWENKGIEEGLSYTIENYQDVVARYPGKAVAIGEAGWTTGSNGLAIATTVATEPMQKIYFEQFRDWTAKKGIVGFFFSAFDENWKGDADPAEPEKHWGLFTVDRKPKEAVCDLYPALLVTTENQAIQADDDSAVQHDPLQTHACKAPVTH